MGQSKPKHIRQDHKVNLTKLISDDRKLKEVERLKKNRTQVKMLSVVGRGDDDITTNLVSIRSFSFYGSNCNHVAAIYRRD